MSPLVSVILPVYNQEKYIAQTIDSILAQTFDNYELIVIDDGSTDQSVDIVKRYMLDNKKILLLVQANTGKPKAIDFAVSKAQGEFLAFIDHDDLMLPNRLEKQITFHLSNPNIAASSCNCYYIDAKNNVIGEQKYPKLSTVDECENVKKSKEIIVCAWTGFMIPKNIFLKAGGLKSKYWPSDDYEFFNRLLDAHYIIVIIQETLMKYRIHSSATTVKGALHTYNMTNYIRDCFDRRRSGLNELTFKEFMAIKSKQTFLSKLKERNFYHSTTILRKASFDLYKKNYLKFSWKFAVAFTLAPKYVSAVISNKIYKHK